MQNISFLEETHKKAIELYTHISRLNLSNIGVQNLKNFPYLPKLKIVCIVSYNRIYS